MAGLFSNLKSEGLEETQDRIGGYQPLETDAYTGEIKALYATQSQHGAHAINLILALEGGKEYRETVYVTNRNGENFFLNKDDKSKKVPLPGYTVANDICLVVAEKELSEIEFVDKVMNIWDSEQKKELPKSVPMAVELLGKTVTVGIVKQLENKSEKDGNGQYQPIADTRDVNFIDKVFQTETKMTIVEARTNQGWDASKAVFFNAWVERNKGNTRDKRTIKDGEGGQSGRPGRGSNASAPQAGSGAQAPKKSLFGS